MIPLRWLEEVTARLRPHIERTPLTYDGSHGFWIKWENRQRTGSFKLRGAINKILSLQRADLERGIVCASAGNHGQAVALAAAAPVEVFAGENAAPTKLASMRALGAVIHVVPGGYAQAETAGRDYARSTGKTWISPYNDLEIIAGQATVGMELVDQLAGERVRSIVVPVGGGGLICGIGLALRGLRDRPRLVGVQPAANAFMRALFLRGDQSQEQDRSSLADGLTGAVEAGSVTIGLVKELVDEIVVVTEEEIARAIAFAWTVHHEVIEGSGAVSLAALLTGRMTERPSVALVTGGNIDPAVHARLVTEHGSRELA